MLEEDDEVVTLVKQPAAAGATPGPTKCLWWFPTVPCTTIRS